jgi:hypothetical protein
MAGHLVYHWKHGWIPLTHAAALSKAHGSARLADRYVPGASAHHTSVVTHHRSARHIHEGLTPHRDLRAASDDDLAKMLSTAEHDQEIERVLAELDRRDRMMRVRRRALERQQRQNAAKEAEFDRRTAAGDDAEQAYADVYGVSVERQRKQQVMSALRENGYRGAGFDALTRAAYRDHLEQTYWDAEKATNGYFFKGTTRMSDHRNPRKLFTGNEAYARAHASDELLAYWRDHGGRLTLADFRASMLGGHLKMRGQAAWL